MICHYESVLRILPPPLAAALENRQPDEIRLRCGQAPTVLQGGVEIPVGAPVSVNAELLNNIVMAAGRQSIYTVQEQLANGFLSLPGGHRIGVCGSAVRGKEGTTMLCALSSLSIRLAREVPLAARPVLRALQAGKNLLILGPPGSGKTTVLRDAIRMLSDELGQRVGVCDERGEIAACASGMPQHAVGKMTDVLTGFPKQEALEMLVRTMTPQWVALDEITRQADAMALRSVSDCGVRVLATAHAFSFSDFQKRPVYQMLLAQGLFEAFAVCSSDRTCRLLTEKEFADATSAWNSHAMRGGGDARRAWDFQQSEALRGAAVVCGDSQIHAGRAAAAP
ncbi:MAG: ATPase, T2SS/T4P/T4SS family [Oscillospiraceae bacterium]|nr:ATPase, T2SS/T4P/T4SS family [Oscillospiraceae bacterium]